MAYKNKKIFTAETSFSWPLQPSADYPSTLEMVCCLYEHNTNSPYTVNGQGASYPHHTCYTWLPWMSYFLFGLTTSSHSWFHVWNCSVECAIFGISMTEFPIGKIIWTVIPGSLDVTQGTIGATAGLGASAGFFGLLLSLALPIVEGG